MDKKNHLNLDTRRATPESHVIAGIAASTDALPAMATLSEEASRSEAAPKQRGLKLNRNLVLGLTLTGVYSFANNIYSTNVFPNFLLEVAGGNTFLFGIAEGLQGLSQLVTAFPIGYLGKSVFALPLTLADLADPNRSRQV